jgi:hypothetical protein
MKKALIRTFTFAVLASLSVLLSCSSREDDALAKRITIDGDKFTLKEGIIWNRGGFESAVNGDFYSWYYVTLCSDGLTFDDDGLVRGAGSLISFDFYSPSTLRLENGAYEIFQDQNPFNVIGTARSWVLKNHNSDPENYNHGEEYDDDVSGRIKISRSGSTYKIIFDLIMEDSGGNKVEVKGSYEGKLEEWVY